MASLQPFWVVSGIGLLILSTVGLIVPPQRVKQSQAVLPESVCADPVTRYTGESETSFTRRVQDQVTGCVTHVWNDTTQVDVEIPWSENWVIRIRQALDPRFVKSGYEYWRPDRVLQRGVGYCSQVSMATKSILEANGIQSEIVHLPNHFVVEAKLDGHYWTVDSDYGVTIPRSIDYLVHHPNEVPELYAQSRFPEKMRDIQAIFETAKKKSGEKGSIRNLYVVSTAATTERLMYCLKWIVPWMLILLSRLQIYRTWRLAGIRYLMLSQNAIHETML